jgi:ubiquinone/menaquinone biosynthesis C-methylase UbiE
MASSIQELYGEIWGKGSPELEERINQSLNPRQSNGLYDMFGELGVGPLHRVLDLGCRTAEHAVELVKRFGCHVTGLEPVALHLEWARKQVAEAQLAEPIPLLGGVIEALPVKDAAFDYIWCRDVLNHVHLPEGFSECARVLCSGGVIFTYVTLATEACEPREAGSLYQALSIVPESMSPAYFEQSAQEAGFAVESKDEIGTEWREHMLESGETWPVTDLLRLARMRRQKEALIDRFGKDRYDAWYASDLWGIYQMLGKLCPTVYVLKKGRSR